MNADNPDLARAFRLIDCVKLRGFSFHSDTTAAGGPLVGSRISAEWVDTIHLEGFTRDCFAWRHRVGGAGPAEHRVEGSALQVLTVVLSWEAGIMLITEGEARGVG
ncbi:MAG: hypothetical protein ACRDSL_17785 [Pseudonocardiaceae bacterium]